MLISSGDGNASPMDVMMRYVKPGDIAYDLGANYGMHTLLLARRVGLTGRVYAFEPNPEIRRALEEHLSLNNLTMVQTVPKAVSNQAGTAWFDSTGSAAGHLVNGTTTAPPGRDHNARPVRASGRKCPAHIHENRYRRRGKRRFTRRP